MSYTEDKKKQTGARSTGLSNVNQQLYEIGKLPPQAVDLEEAVLGALLIDKDALSACIDILSERSFYKESHGLIFGAINRLFNRSEPIDILTVTQELQKSGELELVGGAYYISQLTSRVGSSDNAEYHCRIIAQEYIKRELITISTDTIKSAYDKTSDVFDLLDNAERSLFSIVENNVRRNYDKMSTLINKAMEKMMIASEQKSGITGVPSGFIALDRVTSGWQAPDLIIVAGRPASGKTAWVLSVARNASVDFKKPIAVFSLEMASVQLVERLISAESEVNGRDIKNGTLSQDEIQQINVKIGRLSEAPMFIDDTPSLSVFELRAKARRLKAQHDIQMIVIDYLQLMTTGSASNKNGNREQEIATISRSLKSIAKELNIPIIALSQLSRAVETRGGDKRPQLSDLRESGSIEADADMVLFIHRPEYYGITVDEEGNSTLGVAEIIIGKHRNGSVGSVKLRFIDRLAKFTDMTEEPQPFTPKENYNPNAGLAPSSDFSSGRSSMHDIEEDPF